MSRPSILALLLFVAACGCRAEPVSIVCFGGSNTFGPRLARSDAYPAQLEALLRSAGYDVRVSNEGTSGQTTTEELGRLDRAVPEGTRIVIFQPGGNDRRVGAGNTEANIRQIVERLLARRIEVLFAGNPMRRRFVNGLPVMTIDEFVRLAPGHLQYDGEHLTREGYAVVAQRLFPVVKGVLDRMRERDAPGTSPAVEPVAPPSPPSSADARRGHRPAVDLERGARPLSCGQGPFAASLVKC